MSAGGSRREVLQILGVLGATGLAGAGTWGALEALVPRSTAEAWHRSVCRYCGTGCTIQIGMVDGKITDVRGDPSGHNRGVICVKGSMLPELPRIPGRLTRPMIRRGERFVEATWDEAMGLVAERFKQVIATDGPDAVAFYGSGQLFTEESYTANKLFKAGIRTNNVDGNPRLCMASAATGYTQTFGKDEPPGSYEDIERSQKIFANVVAKYYGDPDFKAQVDADPAGTLRKEGLNVPPGVTVKLLFNTDKVMHVVLPNA